MSEVAHTPQLRFPEFIGEWDVTNFGNISSIKRGASPRPISSPKWFDKDSSVGWVRISDVTKSKKYLKKTEQYLSEDGINRSRKVDKGNLIMSICATIGKPIYTNFNVCIHDGFIVFDSLSEDKGFIYYLLEKIQKKWYRYGQPGTQVNLNSDIVSSEIFSIPTKPEQQKIAAFLAAVDSKIEQLSKKQELLGEYKKGAMQQIFSQATRFKADDGSNFPDWEEVKLGNLTHKVGKKNKENIKYPIYSINNQEGFRPQSEQFDGLDSNDRGYDISLYKIVNEKTFAYNPARINVGSIGYSYNLNKVIVSSLYVCFKTNDELEDLYLLAYLDTDKFNKDILRYEEGGVRQYLFYENFSQISIPLPGNDEQAKISNFLSSIDNKIEQVDKQLDESKQFKKALLQQMFV